MKDWEAEMFDDLNSCVCLHCHTAVLRQELKEQEEEFAASDSSV